MTETDPIVEGVRAHLRQLVDENDLVKNLAQIQKVAAKAHALLIAVQAPDAKVLDQLMLTSDNGDDALPLSSGVTMQAGQLSSNETFGAKMIREVIAGWSKINSNKQESPEALVRAIADARLAGMTDVAAELETRLVGKPIDGDRPVTDQADRLMKKYLGDDTKPVVLSPLHRGPCDDKCIHETVNIPTHTEHDPKVAVLGRKHIFVSPLSVTGQQPTDTHDRASLGGGPEDFGGEDYPSRSETQPLSKTNLST